MSSTNPAAGRRAAVTGASGYLGRKVAARLQADGWDVLSLGRRPSGLSGVAHARLLLGEGVSPELLRGFDALVHCAWDFRQRTWQDIERLNVGGAAKIFEAAGEAGVGRVVHISTVSAAGSPRSMYGRAKLQTEKIAEGLGGVVVRPGLLYGPGAGGMVGMLSRLVRALPLVPVLVGDDRPLYLAHQDDATSLIAQIAGGAEGETSRPIIAAAPDPHPLREVLEVIARTEGRRRLFLRVPWRLVYLPLRAAELARLPLPLRADSARSIATLDPDPFRTGARLGAVEFRRFDAACAGGEIASVVG